MTVLHNLVMGEMREGELDLGALETPGTKGE